jgi:diguanylate cyclase
MDGRASDNGQRPVERTIEEGQRFARRMYLPRALGLGVGALAVGGGLWERHAPLWMWLLLAAHAGAWAHIAYRLARRSADPQRAERRNLVFDSAAGGLWVAAMGFNLVPSAVLVAMLAMDKAAVGGLRFLAKCLNAQLALAALMTLATGFAIHLHSGMVAIVATLPLLLAYPVTVGTTAYRLARRVRQQNDLLSTLSSIDGLTRLLNRTHWEQAVAAEFQRCRRIGHPSSLMMLDIDHFKAVNDAHGHPAGDEALRRVASILRESLRLQDMPGRYGGEEFGIVLPGADANGAALIAERVRKRIESTIVEPRHGVRVTVSIGYAAILPNDRDYAAWIARADRALYAAKAMGRNRVVGHELGAEAQTTA